MKKKYLIVLLVLFLGFPIPQAKAEMPAKVRAFMLVSGYGTVGGALLGFASMAFGSSPRAIAQGASLGLYAGIIFGSYVLFSYKKPMPKGEGEDEYGPDGEPGMMGPDGMPMGEGGDPYAPDGGNPGGPGQGQPGGDGGGDGFSGFPMFKAVQDYHYSDLHEFEQSNANSGSINTPSLYVPLVDIRF
ncbi:hypothetical protein N9N67_08545 [Bacteriovoracaceae bacterium]|nr:hypothetical protein [Bacteriovoracaceae bacterium]